MFVSLQQTYLGVHTHTHTHTRTGERRNDYDIGLLLPHTHAHTHARTHAGVRIDQSMFTYLFLLFYQKKLTRKVWRSTLDQCLCVCLPHAKKVLLFLLVRE